MKTQYITVTDNLKIDVKLEEDVEEVEEVVVTGYQTINKRRSTSAISSVKAEDILVPGMTSIDQALEGRIPDLQLMLNSGEVGATPRIRVQEPPHFPETETRYGSWTGSCYQTR